MQHNYEERYYSPQFSEMSSVSVRRLAWALDTSMVKAVEELINFLPQLLSVQAVCLSCKDNTRCEACIFSGIVPQSSLSTLVNG